MSTIWFSDTTEFRPTPSVFDKDTGQIRPESILTEENNFKLVRRFRPAKSAPDNPPAVQQRIDLLKPLLDGIVPSLPSLHHQMSSLVVLSIYAIESSAYSPRSYNNYAVARGIGQFIPATADAYGVRDPWNYADSCVGTAKYMNQMLNLYNFIGNRDKILMYSAMAYNAGPGKANPDGTRDVSRFFKLRDGGTNLAVPDYGRKFANAFNGFVQQYYPDPNTRPANVQPINNNLP